MFVFYYTLKPNPLGPLQYSCLENPHGQRSLAGYSPWDCKESETIEQLSTAQHNPLGYEGGGHMNGISGFIRREDTCTSDRIEQFRSLEKSVNPLSN